MADEDQPPPLFPDDDAKDNDEDLFATSAAVCGISSLLIFALKSRSGRGRPVNLNTCKFYIHL